MIARKVKGKMKLGIKNSSVTIFDSTVTELITVLVTELVTMSQKE